MSEAVTEDGRHWFAQKALDEHQEVLDILAVGDGTSGASQSDTSLDNKLYEGSTDGTNVTITTSSNTGEIVCRLTLSGGTEVPGGTDISEFGVFSDRTKTLIYRENRSNVVTIQDGDTKSFQWTITVQDN